jgi:uncharacterized membrane protein YidH (DUF202 family)
MKKIVPLILVLAANNSFAQTIDMADTMYSNGKIYVVVAVILLIFAILILYLIKIDKKLTQLENKINQNN